MKSVKSIFSGYILFFPLAAACSLFLVPPAFAADTVNYDTAWTFVYDGGKEADGTPIDDYFYDVKELPDGGYICVGQSYGSLFFLKLDTMGKMIWKKLYIFNDRGGKAESIFFAKNGDFIIGGNRCNRPCLWRTDNIGIIKWQAWYYDTVKSKDLLIRAATVNCVKETKRGTVICAVGDPYPLYATVPNNYAAYLEFDSTGKTLNWNEWNRTTGYELGGYSIEETRTGCYLLSGNKGLVYIDTNSALVWKKSYSFYLTGVGTEINEIARAKMLRDSSLFVAGRAYEGNCWTNYKKLLFDAWWSPISYAYGVNASWNMAGRQGSDDYLRDFTQLKNGNLVFTGLKGSQDGAWLFVTDSTGQKILWENNFLLPYLEDPGDNVYTHSICSTNDGGFTVVGFTNPGTALGKYNALATHFIPKSTQTISHHSAPSSHFRAVAIRSSGSQIRFHFTLSQQNNVTLTLYDAAGKKAAAISGGGLCKGENVMTWSCSRFAKGVYFYFLNTGEQIATGKVMIGGE